jgi:hypothetical protein
MASPRTTHALASSDVVEACNIALSIGEAASSVAASRTRSGVAVVIKEDAAST